MTLLRSGARLGRLQLAAHRLRPVLECAGVDADAHPGPWRGCRAPALVGARGKKTDHQCEDVRLDQASAVHHSHSHRSLGRCRSQVATFAGNSISASRWLAAVSSCAHAGKVMGARSMTAVTENSRGPLGAPWCACGGGVSMKY